MYWPETILQFDIITLTYVNKKYVCEVNYNLKQIVAVKHKSCLRIELKLTRVIIATFINLQF